VDQGTLQGIGTVLAMVAFVGICWWAFSRHKKKDFDEASRLPFTEDELKDMDSRKKSPGDDTGDDKGQH